jgi:hypothetical protein
MTIFLILLMILAIIINVIISNSINENFETTADKLIYLYDTNKVCSNCEFFNNTWNYIENEVKNKPFFYNFITIKYNINTDTEGKKIAKDNKITTPPAIIFVKNDNYKIYRDQATDATTILDWVKKINEL